MSLVDQVVASIQAMPDYEDAIKIIRKNSYAPFYLVGGKVYRTVASIIHGVDCGADRADWDALVLGEVKLTWLPYGWSNVVPFNKDKKRNSLQLSKGGNYIAPHWRYNYGSSAFSGTYTSRSPKIDLISVLDVPGNNDLSSYFDVVPLDIQMMALDLRNHALVGHRAMQAITQKKIAINNPTGCLGEINPMQIMARKAQSMGFSYEGQVLRKTPCDCYDGDTQALWHFGCKFPQFHC